MSDITLILDHKELTVRMDAGTVRIDRPGHKFKRVPMNMIETVIVIGSPLVSCDVWRALAENNIPVVLLPSKGKGLPAYIGPGLTSSANIRMAQYKAKNDQKIVLHIARWLFDMKLRGQISILENLDKDDPETQKSCQKITLFRSNMTNIDSIAGIMGYEGSAATEYFRSLSRILPKKWNFSGRNRRPPKDPINALFSLSYVIAGSEVRSVVYKKGLDPAMGLVHSIQDRRESLVLDVLEPIRPITDGFVLWLIFNKLTMRDFIVNEEKCLLNKKGRKIYYYEWSKWLSGDGYCGKKDMRKMIDEVVVRLVEILFDL